MTLRVVGAGLGRTGTYSLKLALERLLGERCYHMSEVASVGHVDAWHEAIRTGTADWAALFDGYSAAVDWPVAAFWSEIADAFPDAIILFSHRESATWWTSCDRTIFEMFRHEPQPEFAQWRAMATSMLEQRFTKRFLDRDESIDAFERHAAHVRQTADRSRLVEWSSADGWGPICAALGLVVPDEPFPHANSTEEFRSRAGWD